MYEDLCYSPDGKYLASSDQDQVHIWEVSTGKKVRTFPGHRGQVTLVRFSQNGRQIATTSHDGTVLIWSIE